MMLFTVDHHGEQRVDGPNTVTVTLELCHTALRSWTVVGLDGAGYWAPDQAVRQQWAEKFVARKLAPALEKLLDAVD